MTHTGMYWQGDRIEFVVMIGWTFFSQINKCMDIKYWFELKLGNYVVILLVDYLKITVKVHLICTLSLKKMVSKDKKKLI